MKKSQPVKVADNPSFLKRNQTYLLFLTGMAFIGFIAQFQWMGHIALLIYVIIALKRNIPATKTFIFALWLLAMVPLSIILANWVIAQNFAAYSFVLFVFGAIKMTFDLKADLWKQRNINNAPRERV